MKLCQVQFKLKVELRFVAKSVEVEIEVVFSTFAVGWGWCGEMEIKANLSQS